MMNKAYTYKRLTDKDISDMWNMPAVIDAPCIDISSVTRVKLKDASFLTYITFVYKWGIMQGQRMERAKSKDNNANCRRNEKAIRFRQSNFGLSAPNSN